MPAYDYPYSLSDRPCVCAHVDLRADGYALTQLSCYGVIMESQCMRTR